MTGGTDLDDDPTREGLDHLQAAAKELLAAARSFLDAVEHVVDDPVAVREAMSTLGSLASLAGRAVVSAAGMGRDASRGEGDAGDDRPRVEHIDVS